jgi:transposase InsO family protein
MKMSPNTLYYKSVKNKEKDMLVLKEIESIIKELPSAGLPTVTYMLKKKMVINRKRVHRIMRENNLIGRQKPIKKWKTTDSKHKFMKHENLIKEMIPTAENQIIVGDVTSYDVNGTDHYLALLMDLHNREIIGVAISERNNTELVKKALEDAISRRGSLVGCIHHTDADVRYCSDEYMEALNKNGLKVSMCVGNVYENAHAESLNKTIKAGEINLSEYESKAESISGIFSFIEKYNSIRPHSSLGGMSPLEYTAYIRSQQFIDNKKNSQK